MTFRELQTIIPLPYFFIRQVNREFSDETPDAVRIQLSRFAQRGLIHRVKQGLYVFADRPLDELTLAAIIYRPSYVSLETALNIHGLIPDIPAEVTSVTTITSKMFRTSGNTYSYHKIARPLYFGYTSHDSAQSGLTYNLAEPEKAFLDWIYLRQIKTTVDMRVDIGQLNRDRLYQFANQYPAWVKRILA